MRRILIITLVGLSTLSIAGCTASGSSSTADSSSQVAPGPAVADSSGTSRTAASDAADDRQVVTTGTATIVVKDPVAAADEAATIVTTAGGRLDGEQQRASTATAKGTASVTLRIPASKLDGVLDRLKKLGRVKSLQLTSDDVTGQTQDLDARITAQRASVDRLVALLAKADTTKDLIALENALSDRQGDLESMEAQQRSLGDQVALSTVTVSFTAVARPPVQHAGTFVSGLGSGWASFVAFIMGSLVVIGVLLPWLAFFAVGAAIVLAIVRIRRSRAVRAPFTPKA